MRNFGIFCIVLGGLSLFGALAAGHNAFGPLFWLALGIALVIIAKQKEDNKKSGDQTTKAVKQQLVSSSHSNHVVQQYPKQKSASKQQVIGSISTSSSLNINIPMTTAQKEAAMCLISYFGGYNDNIETEAEMNQIVYTLSYQASIYFGIQNFPEMLPGAMSRNSDPDKMLDTVITIEDRQYKEFLLLTCHDLTKMSGKAEAYELLYNIANEMGYNKERFNALIHQYSQK
mgnify:FL=1